MPPQSDPRRNLAAVVIAGIVFFISSPASSQGGESNPRTPLPAIPCPDPHCGAVWSARGTLATPALYPARFSTGGVTGKSGAFPRFCAFLNRRPQGGFICRVGTVPCLPDDEATRGWQRPHAGAFICCSSSCLSISPPADRPSRYTGCGFGGRFGEVQDVVGVVGLAGFTAPSLLVRRCFSDKASPD